MTSRYAALHEENLRINVALEERAGGIDSRLRTHFAQLVLDQGRGSIPDRYLDADLALGAAQHLCAGIRADAPSETCRVVRLVDIVNFHLPEALARDDGSFIFEPGATDDLRLDSVREALLNPEDRELLAAALERRMRGGRDLFFVSSWALAQPVIHGSEAGPASDYLRDRLGLIGYQPPAELALLVFSTQLRDNCDLRVPNFVDGGDNPAFCQWAPENSKPVASGFTWDLKEKKRGWPEWAGREAQASLAIDVRYLGTVKDPAELTLTLLTRGASGSG